MNQAERERKIFRMVASTLLVGLLSYGLILIGIQNYNAKKRADLPEATQKTTQKT
jgi:hypothetical protein